MNNLVFHLPDDFIRNIGIISRTRREQILKTLADLNSRRELTQIDQIKIDHAGIKDDGWTKVNSVPSNASNATDKKETSSSTGSSSLELVNTVKPPSTLRYEQIKNILKMDLNDPKNFHLTQVCDFETTSSNHTFVAGDGFVVGNCSMVKHAMSVYHSAWMARFDTTVRMLAYPSQSLFETQMNRSLHLDELSAGQTVIIALMTFLGYNQEDAMIFNRASLDVGKFRNIIYRAYASVETLIAGYDEKIGFPPAGREAIPVHERKFYNAVDDTGIAIPGRKVNSGDVLIVKYRQVKRTEKEKRDDGVTPKYEFVNTKLGPSEEGIVHTVLVDRNGANRKLVRVRIRQMRIPEIGDKLASRHAQKSTVGAVFSPEDMPFTSSGVKPDLLINPHCLVGSTPITCQSGISRLISSFPPEGGELIYSWNKTQNGLIVGRQMEMASKGVQDILQITLQDGRTLKCTPDHKLLVKTNDVFEYVEAQKIDFEQSRMVMGLEGAIDDPTPEEQVQEKTWKLTCHEHEFTMTDYLEREKAMAFARLLGFVMADGTVSEALDHGIKRLQVGVYPGHKIDCDAIIDDIELITDKRPTAYVDKETYGIHIPAELGRSIGKLPGMSVGKRSTQEASWPEFLLDKECPKSILREFLGGLFGGDGHAPHLARQKYIKDSLAVNRQNHKEVSLVPVKFSQTIVKTLSDSMHEKMKQLCDMLYRVGISRIVIEGPYDKRYSEDGAKPFDYKENPRIEYVLRIKSIPEFTKLVGFRYCIQKWCMLTAANAYCRFQNNVKTQHATVLERAFDLHKNGKLKQMDALEKSIKELEENSAILNEYYAKPSLNAFRGKMQMKSLKVKKFDYKKIDDVVVFVNKIGCLPWFDNNQSTKKHYVVTREMDFVPTFTMKILDRRPAPPEEVFDISVAGNESFIANGILSHNCLPSRMTIAKLIEIVTSKEAAFSGERVNATAYRDFDLDEFRRNLVQYGFRDSGNELLRNPFTGQYMKGQIFVGPCYYQALRHQVKDKYQMRAKGRVRPVSFQPIGGRKHLGAIRSTRPKSRGKVSASLQMWQATHLGQGILESLPVLNLLRNQPVAPRKTWWYRYNLVD